MAQSPLHPESIRPIPFRLRQKSMGNRLWMNIGQTKPFMDGGAPQPGTSSPSAFRQDSGEKEKRDGDRRYGFHELPDTAIQADETCRGENPLICRRIAGISGKVTGKSGNVFQGVFHGGSFRRSGKRYINAMLSDFRKRTWHADRLPGCRFHLLSG